MINNKKDNAGLGMVVHACNERILVQGQQGKKLVRPHFHQ
jgi:hypothetical protein